MSDFLTGVGTSLAVDLSKRAIASLSQYLSRWGVTVASDQRRLEAAIAEHQKEVKRWSEEISFKDLFRPKSTREVFVPLDIYLVPQRQHISTDERLRSAPLSSIFEK